MPKIRKSAIVQHLFLPKSGAQLLLQVLTKTRALIEQAAESSHLTHSCSCSGFLCICVLVYGGEEEGSSLEEKKSSVDLSSSSNTLCESARSNFFHFIVSFMLLDIFFYAFRSNKKGSFLRLVSGSHSWDYPKKKSTADCSCVGVFFILFYPFDFVLLTSYTARVFFQKRPDIAYSSSALNTSCLARLQVDIHSPVASFLYGCKVVGETDTDRGMWVGGEERA